MPEHPLKQRFVLDTSLFLTDEIREDGESLADALEHARSPSPARSSTTRTC